MMVRIIKTKSVQHALLNASTVLVLQILNAQRVSKGILCCRLLAWLHVQLAISKIWLHIPVFLDAL